MTRVAVFIDYQNNYHRARAAFFPRLGNEEPAVGHHYPLQLAQRLNDLGNSKDPDRLASYDVETVSLQTPLCRELAR